ncbi:fibronectin type III domain-containing protein 4 isoform X1 [Carassius gibelio]|uniref:fibronectin type III domain-containing protein 4 isoform X1 n=1 Tax=Carassius gibelio TaxID=101364 RepID=UPI00227965A8|nr:fibronectin type III domain-containing protein 4 isoform X1 [Carassius gibelio]
MFSSGYFSVEITSGLTLQEDMIHLVPFMSLVLSLFGCHICSAGANRPAVPVNVSVSHLGADSATVSWNIPEGETVIGFAISQQRQDGLMQRFIREVNTTSQACILWDLDEDTDYIIQVQSVGLYGESLASKKIHFRTLKKSEHFQSTMMDQDDPAVEGLDMSRHLQTGEILIIMTVLLMWAGIRSASCIQADLCLATAVIVLFCKQYDIIKDNDSNSHSKEKSKPLSGQSTPDYHHGGLLGSKFQRTSSSVSIIKV